MTARDRIRWTIAGACARLAIRLGGVHFVAGVLSSSPGVRFDVHPSEGLAALFDEGPQ